MLIGSKKNFIYVPKIGLIEFIDFADVKRLSELSPEEIARLDLTKKKEAGETDSESDPDF